ncbi:MAG TPA: PAS domain S-box protein [Gemmatales bacterium]|nr:PAS domain S-box protein [Gemmatales bacterium]
MRLIVIGILLLPSIGLGILSLADIHVPTELFVVTIGASLVSIVLWAVFSSRFTTLYRLAELVNEALDHHQEQHDALVEPLQARAMPNDPIYQALVDLADRLSERRRQIRTTVDKLGGILITLSQNKALEMNTGEFDLPDADDRTLLLGSLCQLITSMQQSRQRGDVFANVLRESPIAMLITDSAYKIRSLNPAAEKMFGYKLQQLLNHSLMELFIEPPIKDHQSHLRQIVLPGKAAIAALQNGRQEVFTTISTGYGKVQLIGLRASFGTHCLFVIRERSKDKVDLEVNGPETIHLDGATATIPMPAPMLSS